MVSQVSGHVLLAPLCLVWMEQSRYSHGEQDWGVTLTVIPPKNLRTHYLQLSSTLYVFIALQWSIKS